MNTPTPVIFWSNHSGLANRLRGLIAHRAMAEVLNVPFQLCWTPDSACDAHFTDLFQLPGLQCIKQSRLAALEQKTGVKASTDADWYPVLWEKNLRSRISLNDFSKVACKALEQLRPAPFIAAAVEEFCVQHPLFLGIHVRLTDNVQAYEYWKLHSADFDPALISTSEGFMALVNSQKRRFPDSPILVCTDNERFLANAAGLFQSRILCFPKRFVGNANRLKFDWRRLRLATGSMRTSSIPDAVVEMFLLSRCKVLGGTYFSSFSKLAACLNPSCNYYEIQREAFVEAPFVDKLRGNVAW